MGTRNLTLVQKDNEIKVAQYGQWDGYPSGNGIVVLDFLKTTNLDTFKERLENTKIIDEVELKELWVDCGADPDSKFVTLDVSDKFNALHPSLSRDTGAGILDLILKSQKKVLLTNSYNFAKDGLFCEWAYLVNLDTNELEVYVGFNKEPLNKEERFYFDGYVSESGYTPIKLVKKYDLNNLPTNEVFIKELESSEE